MLNKKVSFGERIWTDENLDFCHNPDNAILNCSESQYL
jgi:hypothetical protein